MFLTDDGFLSQESLQDAIRIEFLLNKEASIIFTKEK